MPGKSSFQRILAYPRQRHHPGCKDWLDVFRPRPLGAPPQHWLHIYSRARPGSTADRVALRRPSPNQNRYAVVIDPLQHNDLGSYLPFTQYQLGGTEDVTSLRRDIKGSLGRRGSSVAKEREAREVSAKSMRSCKLQDYMPESNTIAPIREGFQVNSKLSAVKYGQKVDR